MDCNEVKQELFAFLYGELDEGAVRSMEEHLDRCEQCRRERDEQKKTLALLDQWPDVDVPIDPARFTRALGPAMGFRLLRGLVVAAAAGIVLAVTLSLLGFQVEKRPGGMIIRLGRPEGGTGEVRHLVTEAFHENLGDVLKAMAIQLDAVSREQDQKQAVFAHAFYQQREEDLRATREMLYDLARGSAAESQEVRRLVEGFTYLLADSLKGEGLERH